MLTFKGFMIVGMNLFCLIQFGMYSRVLFHRDFKEIKDMNKRYIFIFKFSYIFALIVYSLHFFMYSENLRYAATLLLISTIYITAVRVGICKYNVKH